MIATGNKNDAEDLLRANYEAVKERMNAGARGMEEAALIDVIALGYMVLGDLKFVASLLCMVSSSFFSICYWGETVERIELGPHWCNLWREFLPARIYINIQRGKKNVFTRFCQYRKSLIGGILLFLYPRKASVFLLLYVGKFHWRSVDWSYQQSNGWWATSGSYTCAYGKSVLNFGEVW